MESWMQEEVAALVAEYGTMPPPWVIYNDHSYSMRWRMGDGEAHKELWWAWWKEQRLADEQKIAYFRGWPPPHCWLGFVIQAVWEIDPFENESELARYFELTAALGFGSQQDYEDDLSDPRWHQS